MFCNANILAYFWVMTRHQYEISALIPQISFWGETSRKINVSCFLKLARESISQSEASYMYIVCVYSGNKHWNKAI